MTAAQLAAKREKKRKYNQTAKAKEKLKTQSMTAAQLAAKREKERKYNQTAKAKEKLKTQTEAQVAAKREKSKQYNIYCMSLAYIAVSTPLPMGSGRPPWAAGEYFMVIE